MVVHEEHLRQAAFSAHLWQLRTHAGSRSLWDVVLPGCTRAPWERSALEVSLLLSSPALGKDEGGNGELMMME